MSCNNDPQFDQNFLNRVQKEIGEIKYQLRKKNREEQDPRTRADFEVGSGFGAQLSQNAILSSPNGATKKFNYCFILNGICVLTRQETWETFSINWKKGRINAICVLLGQIARETGISCVVDLANETLVQYVEDMFQKTVPTGITVNGINMTNFMKSAGVGVLISLCYEVLHFIYCYYKAYNSTDELDKAHYQKRGENIFTLDNLLRHIISIGTSSLVSIFLGTSIPHLIIGLCICQIALWAFEKMLASKNDHGGYYSSFWVFLETVGFVSPENIIDIDWNIPETLAFPEELVCPISNCLLFNPVITPEGHIYSRSEIERWLSRNNTDPLSRSPLTFAQLKRCHVVEQLIQEFVSHYNIQTTRSIIN